MEVPETNDAPPPPFQAAASDETPPSQARGTSDALPEYEPSKTSRSKRNIITERVFTLDNNKGKSWAFLKVNSRGSTHSTPSFFQGDLISGTVELDLEKTESFLAITLEVRGESLAVGQEPIPFYSEVLPLWSSNSNHPGPTSPKLKGEYIWPYSVKLPDKIAVPSVPKGPTMDYSLPPITERASPAYLEYKIIVTFKRGLLRANSTLVTLFAYLPRITPLACSSLRQLAYQENNTPPPPKIDPEGWHDLGSKSVTGIVFETRQVDVSAVFFLAKPLSYTRGLFIPFSLTLSCPDTQALDLFTGRGSLDIKLNRSLSVGATASQAKVPGQRTDTTFHITVAEGIYWLADGNVLDSETRRLEGEIPLKPDLKPTFVFPNVTVKYTVTFALTVAGFVVLSNNGEAPVYEQEVEITTLMPPGAVPRSRSVVVVNNEGQSSGNYDVSIGVLTQANQRFIHLGHHGMG
ncbi:hypothetical protein Clacol_009872 [Clathrus columnatus]|uniref:Arrestin-like N-terminal domain-containing protein n=1 Tax=Clathrus columnatus TaxID=1419009 RepID=A0AAV5AS62_9AGAM|nr:hypothetical protein Clacol_009872 [Clathrus columnatus]